MAAVAPIGELPLPGPPYQPQVALLGLIPTVRVDVPICIVLIVLFAAGAGLNLAIFVRNKASGHKFLPSGVLVGFCLTRIIALSLRIAWASQPLNVSLNIAANVFAAAGVVLLFILNLIFTHRLLRGLHPTIGWHPYVGYFMLFLYLLTLACLISAVTATVVSFYTLVYEYLHQCRIVQLFTATTLALIAFLPIPILLFAAFYPGRRRPEPFGYGSLSTKILIVLLTATLLTIGAAYRCAVVYAVRPAWAPAWWHHKACYYIFNYDLELVVVFTYALMRFDQRFHVPDKAGKPGDYAKGQHAYKRVSGLAARVSVRERRSSRTEYLTPSGYLARSDYLSQSSYLSRTDYLSRSSYLSGSGSGSGSGTRSSRSSQSEEISNEINGGGGARETRETFREREREKKPRGRPSKRRRSRERRRSHERRRSRRR
ncbi:hypothetical protein EsH8_VIII_000525 [Colletotrichum jinshuiense]